MIELFLLKTVGIPYDQIEDVPLEHINAYMTIMSDDKESRKKPSEKNQVEPNTDWSWIKK